VIYGRDLLDGLKPGHVIADRVYDAEHFHGTILDAGATTRTAPPAPLQLEALQGTQPHRALLC